MKTYKQFLESKFNLNKADITPKGKQLVKDIAKTGWKIKDSTDFIVTGDGFEITFTKGSEKKTIISNKSAEEALRKSKDGLQ